MMVWRCLNNLHHDGVEVLVQLHHDGVEVFEQLHHDGVEVFDTITQIQTRIHNISKNNGWWHKFAKT